MIKGEKRKDYDDFEEEIVHIAGHVTEKYGLDFFFEHVYQTFGIAEKAILKNSDEYKQLFGSEDYEVRQSIYFHDPLHEINSNPLTTTLYNSHFITLHSEFEIIWDDIVSIHNKHFTARQKVLINNSYVTHPTFNSNCILDKTLLKHQILTSYNLIRNKIVHGFCKTSSPEYQTVKKQIDSSIINHIRTKEEGDNAYFRIESIKFCREYGNKILHFIQDIADTSFEERKHAR